MEEVDFYSQAYQIAMNKGWISVDLVRSKLKLSYGYALSLAHALEHKGIVGPIEKSGKRYIVSKSNRIKEDKVKSQDSLVLSKEEIPAFALEVLGSILDTSGGILYSSHETIQPGKIYLIGLNPGGHSGPNSPTVRQSIVNLLTKTDNAFLDEAWDENINAKKGEGPLQRRVKWIIEALGADLREVFSTNLIFAQTPNSQNIPPEYAKICWPVHEAFLNIVQPSMIVAYGNGSNSPYSFIHSRYGGEQDYTPSGHGDWNIKRFKTLINGRPTTVIGFPHFSYYHPQTKASIEDWLKANQPA